MTKPLPLTEYNKLVKMMGLTTSENDHEALAALRQANKVLEKGKLTWADVFNRLVSVDMEEAEPQPDTSAKGQSGDIERAFEIVKRGLRPGSFNDFISSLEEQWREKGYLSPAQREALFKAERNARQPAHRR